MAATHSSRRTTVRLIEHQTLNVNSISLSVPLFYN